MAGEIEGVETGGGIKASFLAAEVKQALPAALVNPREHQSTYSGTAGLAKQSGKSSLKLGYIKVAVGVDQLHGGVNLRAGGAVRWFRAGCTGFVEGTYPLCRKEEGCLLICGVTIPRWSRFC
jgi:hypothetical protein